MHAPNPIDVEQLRLVAADAEAPLTDADLAFLASEQLVLRTDGPDRLAIIGIATTSYFPAVEVGRAIAEARAVWAVIEPASRSPDGMVDARAHSARVTAAMTTHQHTVRLPLTRERLLTLLDDVIACPEMACLERVRLAIAGAAAHGVHARIVRDLIAMRAREVGAPDTVLGTREQRVARRGPWLAACATGVRASVAVVAERPRWPARAPGGFRAATSLGHRAPQSSRVATRSHSGNHRSIGRHSHAMVWVRPSALNAIRARSVSPVRVHTRPSTAMA